MNANPDHPARRSIRLQDYDYADEGAYFVTICTHGRVCAFGDVVNGAMRLNRVGEIVTECWNTIPTHFPGVKLDTSIVMPNHVHGIIVIAERMRHVVGATHGSPLQTANNLSPQHPKGPPKGSLGAIVGQFKSSVSRRLKDDPDVLLPLWQRNYYEHVIRDEDDLNRIREYIECNPQMWASDVENPLRRIPT
jgi:REP element-mobilizing transposase RayT